VTDHQKPLILSLIPK